MTEESPASKRVKVGTDEETGCDDVAMDSSPKPGIVEPEGNALGEEDAAMEDAPEEEDDMFTGLKVQQLMKQYYGQIFPFEELFTWLAYGNDGKHPQADKGFSQRREICFTLQNDIFVRYQSYKSSDEMRKGIMGKVPAKIDIGPIYSVDPQRRAAYASGDKSATSERIFVPVERELVFDIDLTDYDDVRSCGKEGHICVKCWPLMALAVKVMDKGLRDDFGFRHILWVFSGRRGIHCWVCDQQARQLTDEQRAAVANYFSIYKGTENGMAKLMVPTSGICPPSVERALEFIREAWEEKLLPEQGLLEDRERWLAVLRFFDDVEDFGARLDARWAAQPDDQGAGVNAMRWQELEAEVAKIVKGKDAKKAQTVQRAVKEVMVAFAYPRLDVEVSKKMNHLLKAPFCVHPKTGKVCVPMDPEEVWDFNPEEVPTVHQLLREAKTVQKARKAEGTKATGPMWEETSMAPCMHLFDSSFLQPLLADCQQTFNEKARQEAAKPTLVW